VKGDHGKKKGGCAMGGRGKTGEHLPAPGEPVRPFLRPSERDDQAREDEPDSTDRGLPPDHVTATYWG